MKVSCIEQYCLLYHPGSVIAWHPSGKAFVVSSLEGEVVLCFWGDRDSISLEDGTGGDISHLAFSADGRFLAGGGSGGRFQIWEIDENWTVTSLERFKFRVDWIDRLVWHPSRPLLAIATGKTIQLWHGETKTFKGVLNFEASSVLDLAWDATGDRLAASGNLAVKIWRTDHWDDAPTVLALSSASSAIAWSPDGQYFAVGLFDRTVRVMACTGEIAIDEAWVMRGFPAKISAMAWSLGPVNHPSQPTLAVVCAEGVLLWDWADDEAIGWVGQVAIEHSERIGSIAWNGLGLAIVGPKLLGLWRSGELEWISERDWYAIHWHPRLPILVGINDESEGEIEIWRFEE
jgi:WD40 repeat protein